MENNATELEFNVVIHSKIDAIPQEQVFPLTLEIYGDDSTLLGTKDVTIRVPAVPNANKYANNKTLNMYRGHTNVASLLSTLLIQRTI